MKNEYKKPVVKMIDYAYQEQVVADSYATAGNYDPIGIDACTWMEPGCRVLHTTDTNCTVPMAAVPSI